MYWYEQANCYHLYPLGCFGCENHHIASSQIKHRMLELIDWIPHLQELGMDALYLGPIFESKEHGYDTIDYFTIDHRLGTNADFKQVVSAFHQAGIKIILDGVFHHVGRDFFAFKDLLQNKESSLYRNWFEGVAFTQDSPYHDGFSYACWEGHYNLVKLNLANEEVLDYLLKAIQMWIEEFQIDGLRLDAANCIAFSFFEQLRTFVKAKRADFFLLGEVIHGDYNRWANAQMLDSTTNYEVYKGLYSSFNSRNFFEIAYSLNRQFGDRGIYRGLPVYQFVDNHDVTRICDQLQDPFDLQALYALLFTIPGIPSIYYGSEWGIHGKKEYGSDASLRPAIAIKQQNRSHELLSWISELAHLRKEHPALISGDYAQVIVRNEQFVFQRTCPKERFCVACNLDEQPYTLAFSSDLPLCDVIHHALYFPENEEITLTLPPKSCILLSSMLAEEKDDSLPDEDALVMQINEHAKENLPQAEQSDPNEIIINGIYRHFKGNLYKVIALATHSEEEKPYVIYRQMYGDFALWVRPLDMFLETIERDGMRFKRFQFLFRQNEADQLTK